MRPSKPLDGVPKQFLEGFPTATSLGGVEMVFVLLSRTKQDAPEVPCTHIRADESLAKSTIPNVWRQRMTDIKVGDTLQRVMDGPGKSPPWRFRAEVIEVSKDRITCTVLADCPRRMEFDRKTGINVNGIEYGWLEGENDRHQSRTPNFYRGRPRCAGRVLCDTCKRLVRDILVELVRQI